MMPGAQITNLDQAFKEQINKEDKKCCRFPRWDITKPDLIELK